MIRWNVLKIDSGNLYWQETLLYDTDVWAFCSMLNEDKETVYWENVWNFLNVSNKKYAILENS